MAKPPVPPPTPCPRCRLLDRVLLAAAKVRGWLEKDSGYEEENPRYHSATVRCCIEALNFEENPLFGDLRDLPPARIRDQAEPGEVDFDDLAELVVQAMPANIPREHLSIALHRAAEKLRRLARGEEPARKPRPVRRYRGAEVSGTTGPG